MGGSSFRPSASSAREPESSKHRTTNSRDPAAPGLFTWAASAARLRVKTTRGDYWIPALTPKGREAGMTTVGIEDLQSTSDRDLGPGEVDYRRFEGNVAFTSGVVPAESGDPVNTGLGMAHGPAKHWSRCLLDSGSRAKGARGRNDDRGDRGSSINFRSSSGTGRSRPTQTI